MPREAPRTAALPFAICVAGCAAMVVAWLVLGQSPGDAATDMLVPLFGWQRLLVVHLVCAAGLRGPGPRGTGHDAPIRAAGWHLVVDRLAP